jgi:hypothetical protein
MHLKCIDHFFFFKIICLRHITLPTHNLYRDTTTPDVPALQLEHRSTRKFPRVTANIFAGVKNATLNNFPLSTSTFPIQMQRIFLIAKMLLFLRYVHNYALRLFSPHYGSYQ